MSRVDFPMPARASRRKLRHNTKRGLAAQRARRNRTQEQRAVGVFVPGHGSPSAARDIKDAAALLQHRRRT